MVSPRQTDSLADSNGHQITVLAAAAAAAANAVNGGGCLTHCYWLFT